MQDISKIIGNRIKIARENKELNQMDLSKFLGYKSQSIISEIESGKKDISAGDLFKLSIFLEVSISYLHGIDINPINIPTNYDEKIQNVSPSTKTTIDQLIQSDEIVKKNTKGLISF